MLENRYKQITISEHISLHDKIIPKDHFLRKLDVNKCKECQLREGCYKVSKLLFFVLL